MAHELGHIALGHRGVALREKADPDPVEDREADVLAEELLMPWDYIRAWPRPVLAGWCERLQVSQEACARRLRQLPKVFPRTAAQRLGLSQDQLRLLLDECATLLRLVQEKRGYWNRAQALLDALGEDLDRLPEQPLDPEVKRELLDLERRISEA